MSGTYLTWPLFLRITSISVAAYDYLLTLPAEYRFYFDKPIPSSHRSRLSLSCILFVLMRYTSLAAITLNNIGFFVHGWSYEDCLKYYLAAPILKVVQSTISAAILGLRTYSISGKSKTVGLILAVYGIMALGVEWFGGMYARVMIQQDENCTAGNAPGRLFVWIFYMVVMSFDLLTLTISTYYLTRSSSNPWRMSALMRMLLFDGLGYFVAITCANILNLVMYRLKDQHIQSSAAPFGYCITWIMSQRILIHIRDAADDRSRNPVIYSQQRSGSGRCSRLPKSPSSTPGGSDRHAALEMGVQVQVERSVVDDSENMYKRQELLLWDSKPPFTKDHAKHSQG